MGILTQALGPIFRRSSLKYPSKKLIEALKGYGSATASGVSVTPDSALMYSAVWACVRILAESVASLPLVLYERAGQGKVRAGGHPLYGILHDVANPEMTSFELRETLMGHLATWGNGYAEIEWSVGGWPLALWPLRPDKMVVERLTDPITGRPGPLQYRYTLPLGGGTVDFEPWQVLHLRGLGGDGIMGYSPIRMHRESIGLGKAAEEFGSRFFSNDARPGGVLQHPGVLDDEVHKRVKKSWNDVHAGLDNSHRVAILEEGMTFKEVGIPPEDAQFLETRKFQVTDVARIYRVPPHMVADLDRATFSNIEHLSIEFVTHTLRPWLVRIEQRVGLQLLGEEERGRFFAEFLIDGLLRGDILSRYQAYAVGRQWGWLSADDVRERENMNELPDGQGHLYMVPLNMIPAEQMNTVPNGRSVNKDRGASRELRGERSAVGRRRLQQAHLPVFLDVAGRVMRRESNDISGAARKFLGRGAVDEFWGWIQGFYREHEGFVERQMLPVAQSYGELVIGDVEDEVGTKLDGGQGERMIGAYVRDLALKHVRRGEARLREALEKGGNDLVQVVVDEVEHWRESQPSRIALEESVREGNYLAKMVYVVGGILRLGWVSFGESCPYCTALSGRVVGIDELFIPAGVEFKPEGAEVVLRLNHSVGHPPAHEGCDCMVVGR